MTEKPEAEFVQRNYLMDPEVDDLLFDGTSLRNGMEVLFADDTLRGNPSPEYWAKQIDATDGDRMKALMYNRWVLISHLRFRSVKYQAGGQVVEFIGTFHDGTKRKFTFGINDAWYVKKHSIPVAAPAGTFADVLKAAAKGLFGEDVTIGYIPTGGWWTCGENCSDKDCPNYKGQKIEDKTDPMGTEKSEDLAAKLPVDPESVTHIPGVVTLGLDYSGPAPEATIRGGASEDEYLKDLREKLEIPEPPIERGPEMFKKNA